ncbi:16370_t:CDS:1, partial [Funneliformis mosseae]
VQNISEFVSERNSLRDYINSYTFRRFISDFCGQVRALEIFYDDLLKKLKRGTNNVDYVHYMSHVKEELMDRYKFNLMTL